MAKALTLDQTVAIYRALEFLDRIKDTTVDRKQGICQVFFQGLLTDEYWAREALTDSFTLWPKFSGNRAYPVASQRQCPTLLGAVELFEYHRLRGNTSLWAKSHAYGRDRRALLAWLLQYWAGRLNQFIPQEGASHGEA